MDRSRRQLVSSLRTDIARRTCIGLKRYIPAPEKADSDRIQCSLHIIMHHLNCGSQHDVSIPVSAVIVLVNITSDVPDAFRLLHRRQNTTSGVTGRCKDNVNALCDQSPPYDLSGLQIGKRTNIIAAHISAGNIGSRIGRKRNDLYVFPLCPGHIFHAAFKTILIVYVGGIGIPSYIIKKSCLLHAEHSKI